MFDGFPYLVTRVAGPLYHVTLLPAGWDDVAMHELARWQAHANQLPTCLALTNDRAIYLNGRREVVAAPYQPVDAVLVTSRLAAPLDCDDGSTELRRRQARLLELVSRSSRQLQGDATKGGHQASSNELWQLDCFQANGVPWGLMRCAQCGDWQGTCLDPSNVAKDMVVSVDCRCANTNRCARCHQLLFERRLNANYYASEGTIIHVPGFCGLSHQCRPDAARRLCA